MSDHNQNEGATVIQHPSSGMAALRVNNTLFKRGGVMARMPYFIACLKLFGLGLLAYTIPFTTAIIAGMNAQNDPNAMAGSILPLVGTIIGGLLILPLMYSGFIIAFKRLRDIRGTTESQLGWQIGLVVLNFIPIVNIVLAGVLFFMPGKVSSGNHTSTDNDHQDQQAA